MAHTGPTPSCLPDPVDHPEPINADQVQRVMERSCWDKKAWPAQHLARREAARLSALGGRVAAAYRCPWHSLHEAKHWHVGRAPGPEAVEQIAHAIRWCTAHPDEVPRPPGQGALL